MKSPITTHVLDTSFGKPAVGVMVVLERWSDENWQELARAVTDSNGRIMNLLPTDQPLSSGRYRLTFHTAEYFQSTNRESLYPNVNVEFLASAGQHYHIPLLISPFGYTTYRGS